MFCALEANLSNILINIELIKVNTIFYLENEPKYLLLALSILSQPAVEVDALRVTR